MARRYSSKPNRSSSSSSKGRKKSQGTELRSLAYKMGQVNLGLKNPNSQITQSYNAGKNSGAKKEKRPLF